jgi:hypothetical protein
MMPERVEDKDEMPEWAHHAARPLPPAARRALREAEARRAAEAKEQPIVAKEIGGRARPEPVRYGDWELKGRAVDF